MLRIGTCDPSIANNILRYSRIEIRELGESPQCTLELKAAFFQHADPPAIQDEPILFDFNSNDLVDIADVVELFGALTA